MIIVYNDKALKYPREDMKQLKLTIKFLESSPERLKRLSINNYLNLYLQPLADSVRGFLVN